MDPVSATASVIACYQLASTVGVQCFHYVRGVQQADRDCDMVIARIENFQNSLLHLQQMLTDEKSLAKEGGRLTPLKNIVDGDSASLKVCSQELKNIRAKLVKAQSGGNLRTAFHRLSWPLKQEEVKHAMTTLDTFARAINLTLSIDTNEIVRGIDSTTKGLDSTTKQILRATENAETRKNEDEKVRKAEEERKEAEKKREKIVNWLIHPDASEYHNVALSARRSAKTGRWFLDGAVFREFKETPRSVLWLHGGSGCGKSVLCSAIIHELQAVPVGKPEHCLAYWYFSINDTKRRNLQNLVRALLTQLMPPGRAPSALEGLWVAKKEGREAPRTSDLVQIVGQTLKQVFADKGPYSCFLVIDALDECDEAERTEIMSMLRHVAMLDNVNIHVLVSSRTNTIGIEKDLQGVDRLFNVAMERHHADEDIKIHVVECLEHDEDMNKWDQYHQNLIKNTLAEEAAGMFRWVDCQLQAIRQCIKPAELKKTLGSLPKTLHEVYARDLATVDDRRAEDMRKVLQWLTFPQRPLRIEEVADMLAVDLGSYPPTFEEDNRMPRPEDVLKMCRNLIRVDTNPEGRDSLGKIAEVRTLTAAHASVVDFLKAQPVRIGPQSETSFTRAAVNLEMAETCLTYLLYFVDKDITLCKDNIMEYPFARLSAELWDDFYREVIISSREEEVDMTRLNSLAMRLFSSPGIIMKWVQLCDPDDDTDGVKFGLVVSDLGSALYYAALLGLPEIVRRLIDDGQTVNEQGNGDCGTPLVAACVYGRENIVSTLLKIGADPNLSGGVLYGCPLAAATEKNQAEIVRLLLETGKAEVNCRRITPKSTNITVITDNGEPGDDDDLGRDRSVESLVYIAAEHGSLELMDALLAAGANPNLKGGQDCTAVNVACRRGDVEIVEKLLRMGADPRIYRRTSSSPLQEACSSKSFPVVKLLVEAGVDVNSIGDGQPSPVHLASCAQDVDMVDLLLEHGANLGLYGGSYGYPLQIASRDGNLAIVQRLILAGIDVNRRGRLGTALYAACRHGKVDAARLLLAHYADPNTQGCGEFDNALQAACEPDSDGELHPELVKLLLDKGASPNLHGGRNGSALHAAFSSGNQATIGVLLERGADTKYKDVRLGSILQAAVISRSEAVVRLALEHEAANEKGGRLTYPLIHACAMRDCPDSIVLLLLKAGADPNLEGEGDDVMARVFRTALQMASFAGSMSKMTMLLDYGARINTVAGTYGPALHLALILPRTPDSMVRLFIDRGADVNKMIDGYGSPLCRALQNGNVIKARILIEAGANLDSVDALGRSALLVCILAGGKSDLKFLDELIDLGSNPLLPDRRGCGCLHYAARANNLGALKKMVKRGVDVNATDGQGWTPLHWGAASTRGSAKVIKLLLREGCSKGIKDKEGRTALDLAVLFERTALISILKAEGEAYRDMPEDDVLEQKELVSMYCDGCGIKRHFCGDFPWYNCNVCANFDFCCRCILDKDITHPNDHTFSEEPASTRLHRSGPT